MTPNGGGDCDERAVLASVLQPDRLYVWAIEIFFRFFKHMLGCRHLLSHNQNGIAPLCRDGANRLRDHRLHADRVVDGTSADKADL